jgi:hypothetical protein
LAWLSQVFDQYTKKKAGRCWRLLLLDGHESHITKPFLAFCDQNRLLLMIYLPHATHSLQALDVVIFKFLSSQYSKKLTNHTHKSLGILLLKKDDFIPLFWSAWVSSFTKKLIFKTFEATGMWPRNRKAVFKMFKHRKPTNPNNSSSFTLLMESDWRRLRQVVQSAVKKEAENQANQITQVLYCYQVQNDLLLTENKDLRKSLTTKKKRNKHGRKLDLYQEGENHGGAKWWLPRKFSKALEREEKRKATQEQERLEKAEIKELKASDTLFTRSFKKRGVWKERG